MNEIWPYVAALVPSVGVGILFYVIIKNLIEGDRRERLAHSQWEAEQTRKQAGKKVEVKVDVKPDQKSDQKASEKSDEKAGKAVGEKPAP